MPSERNVKLRERARVFIWNTPLDRTCAAMDSGAIRSNWSKTNSHQLCKIVCL